MTQASKSTLYAGLAYLVFVVYGSLVPLDFHDRSWDDAWRAFCTIPFLNLGIGSRADWISNILLYIPLTFIWSSVLAPRNTSRKLLTSITVISAAIALSISIEFTQLFFPQRTVSLNDMLAETIGSIAGVVLWHAIGSRITEWIKALRHHGNAAITAALSLYALAYFGFSLFPYDFVVSADELAFKFANNHNSFFVSTASYKSSVRCLVQLLVEMLAVVPLGLMLARVKKYSVDSLFNKLSEAFFLGSVLGLFVEGAQLFLNSGVSQGISVVTRSVGAGLGAYIFIYRHALITFALRFVNSPHKYRGTNVLASLFYLLGLVILQNWWNDAWRSWEDGMTQLSQLHFLPFYYHYFTTETNALISLWFTLAAYAPVGVLVFSMTGGKARHGSQVAALLAACLAATFEFLKLFQASTHPDPTNILIAASAASLAYLLVGWFVQLLTSPTQITPEPRTAVPTPHSIERGRINPLAIVCCALLAWAIACYPLSPALLALGLICLFLVLRQWPQAWLLLIPAALPVLDFTPWTGRFFFDEFDCLLLATLAIVGWRRPLKKSAYHLSSTGFVLFALFTLSVTCAVIIGTYPFPAFDANAFNNYTSAYNALRMGKGVLWALLFIPLIKSKLERNASKAHRLFALGMSLGILATGLSVLWERIAFTGLFNFIDGYRVVGMFSSMHTGGANIEAYLVIGLPFVSWRTWMTHDWKSRIFGGGIFVLGIYAMAVTYARGGYIALSIGTAVFVVGMLYRTQKSIRSLRAFTAVILPLPLACVAWLLMNDTHIQDRFSTSQHDLQTRVAHWDDALQMMDDGYTSTLFGMGLGRYPDSYFWRSKEGIHPATYRFKEEAGNTYLALSAGSPLYFEQIVPVQQNRNYQLHFFARSQTANARVLATLCEKWMLYSANCVTRHVRIGNTEGQWRQYATEFNTHALAHHSWFASRPIKFSINNPVIGSVVEIDSTSLIGIDRIELLKNGDFTQGMDHWFFSTDNHQAWHLENLWVQLYFEQGVIGVFLFVLLVMYALLVLVRRYQEKIFPAAALAAALTGFLFLGTVDSLFDFPRMTMLFFLLIGWVTLPTPKYPTTAPTPAF